MCGILVGLPKGSLSVITLDQHVIHRWTRIVNVKGLLSKSLEPTTYHPQEDRKWILSPSLGEIERNFSSLYHLMCGILVGLPKGSLSVITLDQHVIHRWTRIVNVKGLLSKSLEPTTYHPQEDRKWILSPSLGEIERNFRETQHWTTSEEKL